MRTVIDVLQDASRLAHHLGTGDARQLSNRIHAARTLASNLEAAPRDVLPRILRSVVVGGGELCIEINAGCLDGSLDHTEHAGEGDGQSLATIVETLPFEIRRCGMAVRMIVPAQATAGKSGERNAPLIALISRALDWYERLDSGAIESVRALAMAENKGTSFVSRVIQLAFLAPDIIEAIALGTQPPELTADRLLRSVPLPENWQSQRELLGFR